MDPSHFPPNSAASGAGGDHAVSPIEGVTARRKKRSLRHQFRETFVAGSARSSLQYVLLERVLPDVQNMVLEGAWGFLERLIRGDSSGGAVAPPHGPGGYTNYGRFSMGSALLPSAQRAMNRVSTMRANYDQVVLPTRGEAEQVIFHLNEVLREYNVVTVANLYELVDAGPTFTDTKWGWQDLRGAGVQRVRDGWVLDLPPPIPLG